MLFGFLLLFGALIWPVKAVGFVVPLHVDWNEPAITIVILPNGVLAAMLIGHNGVVANVVPSVPIAFVAAEVRPGFENRPILIGHARHGLCAVGERLREIARNVPATCIG